MIGRLGRLGDLKWNLDARFWRASVPVFDIILIGGGAVDWREFSI